MERLIKIGSVSDASKARRILLNEGIRTRLTKTEMTKEGCVWGLKLDDALLRSAVQSLLRHGFSYEIQG